MSLFNFSQFLFDENAPIAEFKSPAPYQMENVDNASKMKLPPCYQSTSNKDKDETCTPPYKKRIVQACEAVFEDPTNLFRKDIGVKLAKCSNCNEKNYVNGPSNERGYNNGKKYITCNCGQKTFFPVDNNINELKKLTLRKQVKNSRGGYKISFKKASTKCVKCGKMTRVRGPVEKDGPNKGKMYALCCKVWNFNPEIIYL